MTERCRCWWPTHTRHATPRVGSITIRRGTAATPRNRVTHDHHGEQLRSHGFGVQTHPTGARRSINNSDESAKRGRRLHYTASPRSSISAPTTPAQVTLSIPDTSQVEVLGCEGYFLELKMLHRLYTKWTLNIEDAESATFQSDSQAQRADFGCLALRDLRTTPR